MARTLGDTLPEGDAAKDLRDLADVLTNQLEKGRTLDPATKDKLLAALNGAGTTDLDASAEDGTLKDLTASVRDEIGADEPATDEQLQPAPQAVPLSRAEQVEVRKSLVKYRKDYEKWSEPNKQRISWDQIVTSLLKDGGEGLRKVKKLQQGGVMFGVDRFGKVMFADAGREPMKIGITYKDARREIYNTAGFDEILSGYTMFKIDEEFEKSQEIIDFEIFTGHGIAESKNKKDIVAVWLAGPSVAIPYVAQFIPDEAKNKYPEKRTDVGYLDESHENSRTVGIRRLYKLAVD
ncbi:MAG: hypothetical protein UT33_C0005G0071 [Candidatus Peregrinibacteria bacterium GW2011_GWC2_39_14]|nr:MAG: hypothetical protein US92_C0001G0071 [Candidatus Peregrinibacteria bacterium GW2011_GWA2_38_36]KKR07127.1 MAG: hypothetical protein UT33_C0005G0071 [Candidatus Peregrinibacteria bacterium GW2011_GWC2_39_14]